MQTLEAMRLMIRHGSGDRTNSMREYPLNGYHQGKKEQELNYLSDLVFQ